MAREIGEKLDDLLDRQTREYLDTIPAEDDVCPDCGGYGRIKWKGSKWRECFLCSGTGRIINRQVDHLEEWEY